MKKILFFFFASLIVWGCSDDKFSLKTHEASISSEGGLISVNGNYLFSLAQIDETIDGNEVVLDIPNGQERSYQHDWFNIVIENKTMSIDVKENKGDKRTLLITVHLMNEFDTFVVVQNKK